MSHQLSTIKGFFKKMTVGENSYDALNKQPIPDADAKLTLFKDITLITTSALETYSKSMSKSIDIMLKEKFEECREQFLKYETRQPESIEFSKDILLNYVIDKTTDVQQHIGDEVFELTKNLEKFVLRPLTDYQKDVSTVKDTRRELKDAYLKVDSCKASLDKARKDVESCKKQFDNARITNVDTKKQNDAYKALQYADEKLLRCEKDLDDANLLANERYDKYTEGLFKKVSEEMDLANYFLEYLKFQHNFHSHICQSLELLIPDIKNAINNYTKKPLFGQSIDEHLRLLNSNDVSPIIKRLVEEMKRQNVFNEEGVFRIAGSKAKMNRLISSINAGYLDYIDLSDYDVHCLASVLKQYLRDLPDSIMCNNLCDDWINAINSNPATKLDAFKYVLKKLPKANLDNLKYIVKFLACIIENSEQNKMTANNISICFGVSLFNSNIGDTLKSIDMSTATSAFDYILSNHNELFPDGNSVKNELASQNKPISNTLQHSQTFTTASRAVKDYEPTRQPPQPTMRTQNESSPFDVTHRYSVMVPDHRKLMENDLHRNLERLNTEMPNPASRHIKKSSLDIKLEDLNKSPTPSPEVSAQSSPRFRKKQAPAPPPAPTNSNTSFASPITEVLNQSTSASDLTLFPKLQNNVTGSGETKLKQQTPVQQSTPNIMNSQNGNTSTFKTPIKAEVNVNSTIVEKPPQPPPIVPARPPPIGFNLALINNTPTTPATVSTNTTSGSSPTEPSMESPTNTLPKPPKPAVPRKPQTSLQQQQQPPPSTAQSNQTDEQAENTNTTPIAASRNSDKEIKFSTEVTSL